MKNMALILIAIALIAGLAPAYPTSLNVIPTADLLDRGSLRMEYENDGYSKLFRADSEDYWLFEMSVGPRLEMGVDIYDTDETNYMANAKYALLTESDRLPAVAFGAVDVGEGGSPTYYLAASKDVGSTRIHAGGIGDRHKADPMLGMELPVSKNSWLLFDWVNGEENYLTAGIYLETGNGSAFNIGIGSPNSSGNPDLMLANVSWTWRAGNP